MSPQINSILDSTKIKRSNYFSFKHVDAFFVDMIKPTKDGRSFALDHATHSVQNGCDHRTYQAHSECEQIRSHTRHSGYGKKIKKDTSLV